MKSFKKRELNAVLVMILFATFSSVIVQARFVPGGGGGGSLSPPVLNSIDSPADAVELSWNSVAYATSYKIYRCDTEDGVYGNPIATTTSCTYTDDPPERREWWYMVKSHNDYGDSGFSNKRSVFCTDGVKKIAVFFWASDCIVDTIIRSKYTNVLIAEDYTKFYYFEDSQDFDANFDEVAAFEISGDIVFFYLSGHGSYDDIVDDSYTIFCPAGGEVYSSHFRSLMDDLDTYNKGFLIESCYSGGWVDDFSISTYLAISTADKETPSLGRGLTNDLLPGEGYFSNWFWYNISLGGNYLEAFNYANDKTLEDSREYYVTYPIVDVDPIEEIIRFPQIYYSIMSTYNFFED